MQYAHIHDLKPFICHALKLKKIKIWKFLSHNGKDPSYDDFMALNRERELFNLNRSHKILIYIDENAFMKMKWTATLKFSSIELKQIESCDLDHLFNWIA